MIISDLTKISDNQGSSCGDSSNVSVSIPVSSTESEKSVTNCIVSPGGMKYFMPTSVDGSQVPFQNQSFDSLDKAYNFYREYGRLGGFDVRKTTEKRDADGTIILKHFVCSKEGFVDGSHSEGIRQRRTVSRRCGCKAKVVMKIRSQNRYYIFNFVELHNHPLASESGRQFLRSSREMTVSLRSFVFDAAKVNIGCSKAFSLVKEMTGGYSNVGATLRDFRNFNRDLKEFVGERDGQMLIDKFKVLQETSKSFYFAYELDGDGHLTMLFWADPTGRRNFEIYGDAVSFDATFDTNKYNMIFAPFTGVDKHDRCVTFAACLLSKEDVAHYNWAFKHFVKAMGRNPVVFITDQCPAMKVSVPASFCGDNGLVASKHRLCMWHIMQKFPIKLGNRLCKETDFMEKMKTYIWSSNLEIDEFESGWKAVIGEFKLEDNKWLSDMYDIRKSWIPAYFRDSPMFGLMRTTSRSESENFFFSQFHKQGDTLCEFWIRFESAMHRQRNETERLDHESNSSKPNILSRWFIEDDAAELFTRSIFYKVQEEILASCLDMQIKRMSEEVDGVTHFEIKDVKVKDKLFKVTVSKSHAVCSCKQFVMCGIVCRHAFCGLKQIGVTKFPRSLVLNRWMKVAESGTSLESNVVCSDYFKMEQVSLKLTNLWFDFRQILSKAGVEMDKLDYVHKIIKQISSDFEKYDGDSVDFTKKDHMAAMVGEQPVEEITILAPTVSRNKGNYFKRLVSDREKAMTKANKRVRRCKECSATTHDSRTCPKKKKDGGAVVSNML
ncbi:protein FAR1-RELATED SEQUENCE 5-like [Daucus carota subsp. sativus]|uniref:protein FAR1-RELATED SEQUENCE 5-like n=1 Tax=Daucus carota subsp. sativus TaxID=79200 RepID=UPI003082C337